LPLVDIASPSLDDVRTMLGPEIVDQGPRRAVHAQRAMQRVADVFLAMGAGVVLVTAGRHGALLRTAGEARLAAAGSLLANHAAAWGEH